MLKIYSKNGKTIILDTKTSTWIRIKTKFYNKYKNKPEFWKFIQLKYFKNHTLQDDIVDTIYFAVTRKCNLNCEFCSMSSNKNIDIDDQLDIYTLKEKLPILLKNQVKKVVVTGGEPFQNEKLFEILELLVSCISKEKITLQTNGLLLKKTHISKLKELVGAIEISIENIVLNASLKEHMEKMFELITQQNIPLSLSYVVTEDNMKYFGEGLELVKKYNTFFSYRIVEPLGNGRKILKNFDVKYAYKNALTVEVEILNFIIENKLWKYKIAEAETGYLLPNGVCGAYSSILAIQPNGLIYPCINIQNKKFELGNLKKDTVKELEKLLLYSKQREKNKKYFNVEYKEKCRTCFYMYFCNGFCGAHESGLQGEKEKYSEYVCKIRKTYLYFEMFCVDNTYSAPQYFKKKRAYLIKCIQTGGEI